MRIRTVTTEQAEVTREEYNRLRGLQGTAVSVCASMDCSGNPGRGCINCPMNRIMDTIHEFVASVKVIEEGGK